MLTYICSCAPSYYSLKPNLLYCIHTLATLEFPPAPETTWDDIFLRIINIRNKEISRITSPILLPAIFFWPYISSSYLWKVFWLPCFWCLFAAKGAEDIEYNLNDSCFYIKRLVSVAINDS